MNKQSDDELNPGMGRSMSRRSMLKSLGRINGRRVRFNPDPFQREACVSESFKENGII